MKHGALQKAFGLLLSLVLILGLNVSPQARIEPGFTYQGELRLMGTATEGEFDFRFRLYDEQNDGVQLGQQLSHSGVTVDDGVFTVHLDFGPEVFTGAQRWLEIDVRAVGDPSFETLAPRTLLATVPYAWAAAVALPGSVSAASIEPGAVGAAQIDAEAVQRRIADACPVGEFLIAIQADGSVECAAGGAGGGAAWLLEGNADTNPALNYLGTSDAQPLVLGANGEPLVRLEAIQPGTNSFTANIVMGTSDNIVRPGVSGAVIAGGGLPLSNPNTFFRPNIVAGNFGTIGGGHTNVAGIDDGNAGSGQWATVGGGVDNQAQGRATTVGGGEGNFVLDNWGTIGGGEKNTVRGVAGTVSGGVENVASEDESVVAGGGFSSASGVASTVAGGRLNCAGGNFSWAGGFRAKVRPADASGQIGFGCGGVPTAGGGGDQGTFIWADSQNANFQSTGSNQFLVRAQGGVFFGTGGPVSLPGGRFINTSTGAHLTSGGNWTNASSRAFKTDFQPIDPLHVLDRLLKLPLGTWTYRSAPDNGRHLGPMAEEFHASFGLGADSTSISTVDASGVALAAIQGLNQRLEAENAALREQNARQDSAIAELRAELDELRRLLLAEIAQQP